MLEPKNVTYLSGSSSSASLDERRAHILEVAQLADDVLTQSMFLAGVMILTIQMMGIAVPYGRYTRKGWGPVVPARAAWVTQEAPSFVVPIAILWLLGVAGAKEMGWKARVTGAAFLFHYFHRAFIHPTRMRGKLPVPLITAVLGFVFTCANGCLQASVWLRHWDRDTAHPPGLWLAGMAMWLIGAVINITSDHHLLDLREAALSGVAGGGYKIPQAGLFRYVSAANYFGEIVEWLGYAFACNHVGAYAFTWFTACMLVPRALEHHRDYQARFGWQYPYHRKAVIPFIL